MSWALLSGGALAGVAVLRTSTQRLPMRRAASDGFPAPPGGPGQNARSTRAVSVNWPCYLLLLVLMWVVGVLGLLVAGNFLGIWLGCTFLALTILVCHVRE